MTDFLKIAKSIVVHFAHICAYGVETVKQQRQLDAKCPTFTNSARLVVLLYKVNQDQFYPQKKMANFKVALLACLKKLLLSIFTGPPIFVLK